jgi:ketosteroid isomerase-like protein
MSQENVDVGRRMLQAFNDGDIEAIVADCDPAVEWEEQSIPGVEPPYWSEPSGTAKLVRRQVFLTLAEALEAVGLRE